MMSSRILSILVVVTVATFNAASSAVAESDPVRERIVNTGAVRNAFLHQPNIYAYYTGMSTVPYRQVSIFQLLANPSKFENEKIVFHGYLSQAQETCDGPLTWRVYATPDALKYNIYKESVAVNLHGDFKVADSLVSGAMVSAVGFFHVNPRDTFFLDDSGRVDDGSICLLR